MELKIKKDGIYKNHWNSELEKWEELKIQDFSKVLSFVVETIEDMSFEEFFDVVFSFDKKKIQTVWGSHAGNFDLFSLYCDCKNNAIPKKENNIDFLEINWGIVQSDEVIEEFPNFCGKSGNTYCNVSLQPVSCYRHLPLKMNMTWNLEVDNKLILSTEKMFTLFELIGTVFYELSFFGTPKMRDCVVEELKSMKRHLTVSDFEFVSNDFTSPEEDL